MKSIIISLVPFALRNHVNFSVKAAVLEEFRKRVYLDYSKKRINRATPLLFLAGIEPGFSES